MSTLKHLYCAAQLWLLLALSWFGSTHMALLTSSGCCAQSFELERGWRYTASMECVSSTWPLGTGSSWAQPCTGACCYVMWFSLLGPSLHVPLLVSSAAEGPLDKDGALHSNCSYPFCPWLQLLRVSVSFFFCPTAHAQAGSKSHLQMHGRALIAFLCTWLIRHKRHLEGPEMFIGHVNQPVNQSTYQTFAFWKIDISLWASVAGIERR